MDKVEVKPLSYSAGPNVYTNALRARWTVRDVTATYPATQLARGFLVHYASFDGSEWSFEVSREDAEEKLLLKDLATFDRLQAEIQGAEANRKATIAAQVGPCLRYPNKRCWHNPAEPTYNDELAQFGTKEEALKHADQVLQISK